VIGVASSKWTLVQLCRHAKRSIQIGGRIKHRTALARLLSLLRYVDGDYNDPATFEALKAALKGAKHPRTIWQFPPNYLQLSSPDLVPRLGQ